MLVNQQDEKAPTLGKPSFQKSAVFLNIVQKAFDPPPFYLNICPILQGVFFKTRFCREWKFDIHITLWLLNSTGVESFTEN